MKIWTNTYKEQKDWKSFDVELNPDKLEEIQVIRASINRKNNPKN